MRGYTDAALPRLQQRVLSPRPVYTELERVKLSFSLDKMREFLGPDSKFVHQILGMKSPEALADELIDGSKLADPAARTALWEGGWAAIEASEDPMIQMALSVDEDSRALRKRYEDEVSAPSDAAYEKIAKVRFAVQGTSKHPDATFTLRVTYGSHVGWMEKGKGSIWSVTTSIRNSCNWEVTTPAGIPIGASILKSVNKRSTRLSAI